MSPTIQEMRQAEPIDFVAAWAHVMHNPSPLKHAMEITKMYPVPADISDPTFYTPEHGEIVWHRARDISNPTAMRDLKGYLYDRGVMLPPEVSAAWAQIMEHSQWSQVVREAFEEVLAELQEAPNLAGAVDLMDRVAKALQARVE